jgi:hypothetical protein
MSIDVGKRPVLLCRMVLEKAEQFLCVASGAGQVQALNELILPGALRKRMNTLQYREQGLNLMKKLFWICVVVSLLMGTASMVFAETGIKSLHHK